MCGIVGYVGPKKAAPILLDGLQRLEYRGYDSAGIAVISDEGEMQVRKSAGKLNNLVAAVATAEPEGRVGIGHTRWATHGRPTDDNAHPHTDCSGDLTVVHNGIIENYAELRDELTAKGHIFRSETDTEVLAHLIEEELASAGDDLPKAVRAALRRVTGAYSIAVVSRHHPGRLVGARQTGPLIAGLGEDENFLASDIPAILRHTRRIVIIEEGEVVEVTRDRVTISDLDGRVIAREPIQVEWDVEAAEKGGYPHFFVKEIHEQPEAVRRALLGRVVEEEGAAPAVRLHELEALAATGALETIRRVVILGCGSSILAGMLGKYAIESWARIPVEVAIASEFRYSDPIVGPETLCVAVTQSGETTDTLAAVRLARERGAPLVAVTNVVGSAITRNADAVLYLQAGPEISVTSTKTYMTTTIVLYELALWLAQRSNSLAEDARAGLLRGLLQLPEQMGQVLDGLRVADEGLSAVAEWLSKRQSCMFIGRGVGYPLALEGALKLKELSYVHAEGYPAGELKHGPIALLDPATPLIAIAQRGHTYEKVVSNIQEVRARDARVLVIATEGDTGIRRHADDVIYVPDAPELLAPLLGVLPLQLLAYHVALARGCNIDQPRNLAKSVTVE